MDSAVGGRTEIVSIDFIFGRLRSGHLVLQYTLLSLSLFLSISLSLTPSVSVSLPRVLILLPFTRCPSLIDSHFPFFSPQLVSVLFFYLKCSFILLLHYSLSLLSSSNLPKFTFFCLCLFPCHFLHLTFPPLIPFTPFPFNLFSPLFCFFTCFTHHPSSPPPSCLPFSAASSFYYFSPSTLPSLFVPLSIPSLFLSLPISFCPSLTLLCSTRNHLSLYLI